MSWCPARARSSLRPDYPETPKGSVSVLRNMVPHPPITHTFLKQPFLTDSKNYIHTPPPPMEQKSGATDEKFRKPGESAKTHRVGTV